MFFFFFFRGGSGKSPLCMTTTGKTCPPSLSSSNKRTDTTQSCPRKYEPVITLEHCVRSTNIGQCWVCTSVWGTLAPTHNSPRYEAAYSTTDSNRRSPWFSCCVTEGAAVPASAVVYARSHAAGKGRWIQNGVSCDGLGGRDQEHDTISSVQVAVSDDGSDEIQRLSRQEGGQTCLQPPAHAH